MSTNDNTSSYLLLCARHCIKYFVSTTSFNPHNNPVSVGKLRPREHKSYFSRSSMSRYYKIVRTLN